LSPDLALPLLAFGCGLAAAAGGAAVRERRRADRLERDLDELRAEVAIMERRDDDTGLWNSRHFVETLTREIERARAYERPVALALASVDDVGADELEEAMRSLGRAIGGSVRALDIACRVGSTEFGVIMPETDSRSASVASERVLRAIAKARTEDGSKPEAAVGIAACPAHAETFEALIDRAGSALRSARRAVRDEPRRPGTVPVAMAVWDDED
jgi:two-component system, cell cycle response regulator